MAQNYPFLLVLKDTRRVREREKEGRGGFLNERSVANVSVFHFPSRLILTSPLFFFSSGLQRGSVESTIQISSKVRRSNTYEDRVMLVTLAFGCSLLQPHSRSLKIRTLDRRILNRRKTEQSLFYSIQQSLHGLISLSICHTRTSRRLPRSKIHNPNYNPSISNPIYLMLLQCSL